MDSFMKGLFYSPEKDAGSDDGENGKEKGKDDGQQKDQQKDLLEWDTFHKSLPAEAQKLISDRESGLKTALSSERDARKDAETDLREVAADLEKGSEAQKKVLKLADEVAAGTQKADFYEDAHGNGVTNLKLAYHVAVNEELFDKRGNVNFKQMKEDYPELFGKKKVPPADGGEGTDGALPGEKVDMNALIRKKAGR